MSVIDLQYNHVGVQSLITQFADQTAAGQGAMLQHTDGYVYCVFARNYLADEVHERRLYVTRSNDSGITWSAAIEISTGNWDDDPAIIQLDLNDIDSNIGVVFNRNDALSRFTFDKDTGEDTSPYDQITGNIVGKKWPSILHTSSGFLICCLARDSIHAGNQVVYQYTNDVFTTNSWSEDTKTVFPTNEQPMSLSVKQLSNGHFAMVAAYRTSLDGLADTHAATGMGNLPAGMLRCDVGAFFSDDEGTTWTPVQKLTNYTGTLKLDLTGILSVAAADLQETSDGKVVVGYQEHTASQFISTSTAFYLPGNLGILTQVKYHTAKNSLFCSSSNSTYGGLFILDLTAQTVTRIYSGSTPALWSNDVQTFDISTDENSIAVGLATGGICILDISDTDPTNWAIIKELRTTSELNPPLLKDNIISVQWDGDTILYFSYDSGGVAWGGRYDTENNEVGIIALHGAYDGVGYAAYFLVQPTKIVLVQGQKITAVDKNTGAELYSSSTTVIFNNHIFYDDINNEYVYLTSSSLSTAIDTGDSFSEQQIFTSTSNPIWTDSDSGASDGIVDIPGYGIFKLAYDSDAQQSTKFQWYSYGSKLPAGSRTRPNNLGLGENVNYQYINRGYVVNNNSWMMMPGNNSIIFQNLANVGRIRYGHFEYDAVNKQLVTSGVDFYDVCNINKVGTNMTTLQFPKFCRDDDDRLYWYFCRWNVLQTNGNEFAPVLGIVEPDTVKLMALSRIRRGYSSTVNGKSRISNSGLATVSARMRIVFAQCIKTRARIVPRWEKTITARACIKNWKSSSCRVSFSIQKTGITRKLRAQFWVNTGHVRTNDLTAKVRIAQTYSCRVTGHFLVQVTASNNNVTFSADSTTRQALSVRSRIMGW